ncbi:MAG: M20/M25/M40 family metallo-hydrolase [Chloroherpetonaceae bacterium]|nr:M20/M25/M40 family metallo-hydrolase [Chthonomonadaceae bacterium]MDW8206620.1 M20/M25/M40 family metallo-hydrolase [Chloroherpetonaceae bacterium]
MCETQNTETDPIAWIRHLITLPGPPGEEKAVRDWLATQVRSLGYHPEVDAKGNLLVTLPARGRGEQPHPRVLVTAHMDEIAMMVVKREAEKLRVDAVGGAHTWKWGEGPVVILTNAGPLPGVLSYGCVHTRDASSVAEHARQFVLNWERAYVFTGKSAEELEAAGVRPGLRVVLAPERRTLTEFGAFIAGHFLDDRADLAVWLLALQALQEGAQDLPEITFAATCSEEVGGEGARYLLRARPADICIALEIGPRTPEADFPVDPQPTIWVRDEYAAMESVDGMLLEACCGELGLKPHWQYLSRGGSDASCAAALGLVARPVTLGMPVENSHGYEILHRDAPHCLARLLLAYLRRLRG